MLHQRFRFQFLKRKCVFCTDERPRKVKADAEFVCLFCAEPERGDGGLVADEVQLVVTGQQQDSFQGEFLVSTGSCRFVAAAVVESLLFACDKGNKSQKVLSY